MSGTVVGKTVVWRDNRQSDVYLTNTGASGEETQIGKPGIEIVCGGEAYPIAAGSGSGVHLDPQLWRLPVF